MSERAWMRWGRIAIAMWAAAGAGPAGLAACSSGGAASSADGGGADATASGDAAEPDGAGQDGAPSTDGTVTDAGGGDAGEAGASDAADSASADSGDCALGDAGEALDLRCAGLYSDFGAKALAPGVVPYDPGLRLWSDGAVKSRFIALPAGQAIDTSSMDEWTFPVGTRIYKEFVLGGVRIETRMLWKRGPNAPGTTYEEPDGGGGWYATTYRWSADGQTSATELLTGEPNATDAGYEIPSQTQCVGCHAGRKDFVLGFEAVSLSSPEASGLTMAALVAQSLVTAAPSAPLTIPGTPVEAAALGYLHANCGEICHNANAGAAARFTGLFMRLEVGKLATVQATDTYRTAWNVSTLSFTAVPKRIAPCDTAASCIYDRPSRRDGVDGTLPGTQMPPYDTHRVDDAGLASIAAWINEGCGLDAGPDQ